MRKVAVIFTISIVTLLLVFISSLLILSIRHQEKIEQDIIDYINSSFENTIHIEGLHLTYLNNFPNASLKISNVVLSNDSSEIIRIGSIKVFFNIRKFLNKSIEINRIIISNAIINDKIDKNGKKSKIRFSKNESSEKKSEYPIHILSPDLELNNIKISLRNEYKKNETYITINQSLFSLEVDQGLISLSGNLSGNLDSLKTNGFTLFSSKKVEGKDIILKINTRESHVYLESGYLESDSLTLHPSISFKKQENGNLTKLLIESSGNLDAHLKLINLPTGLTLKQLDKDAEIKISYSQDGLANPITRPYNQLKFEIKNANFTSPIIPYPVENLHIIGNYNNGEKHIPETNNLIIDTLNFEIEESFVNARLLVNNFKDPIVKGHFISEIDLRHILHDDKYNATGSVHADLFIDGKISELKKNHLNNKQHAYGSIRFKSVDLLDRDSNTKIKIRAGSISMDNHYIKIMDLNGHFNDSHFNIQGELNNLDQFILKNNNALTGHVKIESDYIDLASLIPSKDTLKTNQGINKIPNTNIDINLHAKKIEGGFGTIDQLIFIGNLNHESLRIDNLTFNFEEGILKSNLLIKLSENGPEIEEGQIKAEFNFLNIDKILNSGEHKAENPKDIQLTQNINLHIDLSIKDGIAYNKEFEKLNMNVIFTDGDIELKKLETELLNGKLLLSSDIKYNKDGIWYVKANGNTSFPHLSVRELLNDFHKKKSSSPNHKESIQLPEIIDINLNIDIDSLEYGGNILNDIHTGITITKDEIDIKDFSVDLNEGKGHVDLQVIDYLRSDPRIIGNIDLELDSVNMETLYESVSGFSTNKKHSDAQISHEIPHNIDINVNVAADLLNYKDLAVENLQLSSSINNRILIIESLNFNTAQGHIEFSGLLVQDDNKFFDGHFYTTGKRLSVSPLIKSFAEDELSNKDHGNIEGYLSFESEGLFTLDSLLNFVSERNLFFSDIVIENGKIADNPQLDTTLSFIGHKAKDDILIKNSEFQIYINGNEIIFQDVLVNNSISNMDIFGRYNYFDTATILDIRISLTDLFFRTKRKRYVNTSDGTIRLFKDLSVFIEFNNSSPKHKIRLHPKRKHRLRRKDLASEIEGIVLEYRKRINHLYLVVEPKIEKSKIPLEVFNK